MNTTAEGPASEPALNASAWSRIDSVLLDLDGTLLDLAFDNHFWRTRVPEAWARARSISPQQAQAELQPRFRAREGTLEWYCVDYWSRELELDIAALKHTHAQHIRWLPGAREFLGRVRALGKRLVLVTNAHPTSLAIKDARITLSPSDAPEYSYDLDYSNTKAIGRQSYALRLTRESFAREIAPARTFGFVHELDYLKSIDRGHGASLENTLAIEGDTVLNRDLMRFPDEFVRHKILDAIGDMALAGAPLIARFHGVKSGHATNNAVLRALFADPLNYETVTLA